MYNGLKEELKTAASTAVFNDGQWTAETKG